MVEGRLREAGIESARAEAEWLCAELLGVSRTDLYVRAESLDPETVEALQGWLIRRVHGEPLQYLIGHTEFFGHRLHVGPGVFIPRPETEVLTEQAIQSLRSLDRSRAFMVLDVGTGSANIAISLAQAVPACVAIAVELSWEALCVAKTNVETHHVQDRVWLIQSDWTSALAGLPAPSLPDPRQRNREEKAGFDLIVSNPPYVSTRELDRLTVNPALQGGVNGQGEPRMSLDGGPDGMVFHRRLIAEVPRLLACGGAVVVECAEAQVEPLRRLASAQAWVKRVRVFEDLASRPRGLCIQTR